MKQDFQKLKIATKYRLQGRADVDPRYHLALKAYEFARKYHTGTRKDGETPEFLHQISQVAYLLTISAYLIHPVETIATAYLHDVCEDYDVPIRTIEHEFGPLVASAVERMTNAYGDGQKKDKPLYFQAMVGCPISSICKGADRMHNQNSMIGVFTPEKQLSYVAETREFILPMLAENRRLFPQQELAYENLKYMLVEKCETIELIHGNAA